MRFQPYFQFLTAIGESEWSQLDDKRQRELLRASRQCKVVTAPEVEQDEDKELVIDERVMFQIRMVTNRNSIKCPCTKDCEPKTTASALPGH